MRDWYSESHLTSQKRGGAAVTDPSKVLPVYDPVPEPYCNEIIINYKIVALVNTQGSWLSAFNPSTGSDYNPAPSQMELAKVRKQQHSMPTLAMRSFHLYFGALGNSAVMFVERLPSISGLRRHVQSTSATKGDGLLEGLEWLSEKALALPRRR